MGCAYRDEQIVGFFFKVWYIELMDIDFKPRPFASGDLYHSVPVLQQESGRVRGRYWNAKLMTVFR